MTGGFSSHFCGQCSPKEEESLHSRPSKPPATYVSRPKGTRALLWCRSESGMGLWGPLCRACKAPSLHRSTTILTSMAGGPSHREIGSSQRVAGDWLLEHGHPWQEPGCRGYSLASYSEFHFDGFLPASPTHRWDPGSHLASGKASPLRSKVTYSSLLSALYSPAAFLPTLETHHAQSHPRAFALAALSTQDVSSLAICKAVSLRSLLKRHLLWNAPLTGTAGLPATHHSPLPSARLGLLSSPLALHGSILSV